MWLSPETPEVASETTEGSAAIAAEPMTFQGFPRQLSFQGFPRQLSFQGFQLGSQGSENINWFQEAIEVYSLII